MKNVKIFTKCLATVLFLVVLIFLSRAVVSAAGTKFGNKNSLKKVLIVSEKNRSGDPVFSRVINVLKEDGCYILLGNQKKLTNNTSKKFGAVVVVNEIKKGSKDSGIKVFLDEPEQKKIILFNAGSGKYWLAVDKSDNSGKIAESIIGKVRTVLKIQNK